MIKLDISQKIICLVLMGIIGLMVVLVFIKQIKEVEKRAANF